MRRGYTLVEALLALGIATLLVGLATGWSRTRTWSVTPDPTAVYLGLHWLEQPGRYTAISQNQDGLSLQDHRTHKQVLVTLNRHQTLTVTDPVGRGNFQLVPGIQKVTWRLLGTKRLVEMRFLERGTRTWQNVLLDLRGPAARTLTDF